MELATRFPMFCTGNNFALAAALTLLSVSPVFAQMAPGQRAVEPSLQKPQQFDGVEITERLGSNVDLNLKFADHTGRVKPLSTWFQSGRPVILNLVYYTCPMLCNLVLKGQVDVLRDIPWQPGKEFEIVTVSIDPTETPELASSRRAAYLAQYERPATGWHFVTTVDDSARKLAEQIGFGYRLDQKSGQYAHRAAIFILTPQGKISRYIYGAKYQSRTLRLALTEAAEEKTGMTMERVLLMCFHYDPLANSYVMKARTIMQAGGFLIVLTLAAFLLRYWKLEIDRKYTPMPKEL
jgi:protein SCO1